MFVQRARFNVSINICCFFGGTRIVAQNFIEDRERLITSPAVLYVTDYGFCALSQFPIHTRGDRLVLRVTVPTSYVPPLGKVPC